jgi:hypothetical protein
VTAQFKGAQLWSGLMTYHNYQKFPVSFSNMKGQTASGGSGGKGAGRGAGRPSNVAAGQGTHHARPSAKWGNRQAVPPHGQYEWGRPFRDGATRGRDSALTLSNTQPAVRASGAEFVSNATGLTLRFVLGAGHSVTSADILLQGVERALKDLAESHSLAEATLPLDDGWSKSIWGDPYWSRSAKERAASFPTFCSNGSSPGAWEVVPDIPPPLLPFAACSAKSLPFYSDIWVKVMAHPPTVQPPAWGRPQPSPPAPAIPKKTGGLVTDFFMNFETDDAAGGMDTGMDLDTDTEFPHLSPPSGSSPGGDPMVTASPAVAALGAKTSLPLTRGSKGKVNRTQFRPGFTAPDNPLEFAVQVQVQPVLPDGTCYLVAVFPFPPFPWRACISEMVARIQQHFERVRSRVRPDLALPHIRVGRIALRGGGNSVGVCEFWVASQEATGMRETMEWLALLRPLSGSTIWLNSLHVGLPVSTEMVDLQRPRFNESMLTAMPWELPA